MTGNRKQSMELERKVMVRLETLIFHMALDETRFVIAGAALFQGYFRARFADGGYTLVFMEEKHFYLMEVSQTKISHLDTGRLPKYMLAPSSVGLRSRLELSVLARKEKTWHRFGKFPIAPVPQSRSLAERTSFFV